MSAIFGIYNLDGKPVASSQIEKMLNILSHRGDDATGVWIDGAIGLGHRMLWTTPESLHEKLPKKFHNSNLTITADARIDNREELLKQLDIHQYKDEIITDSDIILFAYEKWGEDCAEKLLGDFVFVIWDSQKKQLFCARDHFGVKPFYYHISDTCFVFATEIKALFTLEKIPQELNEEMIADYLVGNFEDKAVTFFLNILRLPPGNCFVVNQDKNNNLRIYFELDPTRELKLNSNEEYAEGLQEIFSEAVRCRMRSAMPIGSMLSGGLDSSSISCVARNILSEKNSEPLSTFSLIYNRIKECDEQEYINLILNQGGFNPHFIEGDTHSPLKNLGEIAKYVNAPITGPGFSSTWDFHQVISDAGVRVIFDGHDGDNAVSYGTKYLDELAQAGKWIKLASEVRAIASFTTISQFQYLKSFYRQYRWKPFLQRHPYIKRLNKLKKQLFKIELNKIQNQPIEMMKDLIDKDFFQRMNFEERYKTVQKNVIDRSLTARESHFQSISNGGQPYGLEECDSVSAPFKLEVRYPFWDKRLIEYCLSLPGDQKFFEGMDRVVMRRSMNNILPSKVCWRKEKTDFTPNIIDGLFNKESKKLDEILFANDSLNKYFNQPALLNAKQYLFSQIDKKNTQNRKSMFKILNIAFFSSWFRQVCS